MKVTPDIKEKWLKALRSGDYKQAESTLYDPDTKGFCCLGVLEHCVSGVVETLGDKAKYGANGFCNLPSVEWGEQNSIDFMADRTFPLNDGSGRTEPQPDDDTVFSKLVDMNDSGEDFKTIAAYIEKHVETT